MSYRTELVNRIRKQYPKGARVELVKMVDKTAPAPGTKGTVDHVDDIGTIHVRWDSGSRLGVIPDVDEIRKI